MESPLVQEVIILSVSKKFSCAMKKQSYNDDDDQDNVHNDDDNDDNNNNKYLYRIALQCKSTFIKGVLSK